MMLPTASRYIFPILLIFSTIACQNETRAIRHDDRLSVWLEFSNSEELAQRVEFAATHNLNLNVRILRGNEDRSYVQQLCALSQEADVALRLWPLLPEEDGYWPNQSNAELFAEYIDELLTWIPEDCPRLDAIMVDMEMPLERTEQLQAMFQGGEGDLLNAVTWLFDGIDDRAYEKARAIFQQVVDRIHAAELRCHLSTLPLSLDDLEDGDESIARSLWTPYLGANWDGLYFQVYRTIFDQTVAAGFSEDGELFTSGLVTSYARTINAWFGPRGGIDLGTTGSGIGIDTGFQNPAELQSDMAAALDAGISLGKINIYSQEGLDNVGDPAEWLRAPKPREAQIDPLTERLREAMVFVDSLHSD